jgi:hypothetical protein
VKREVAPNRYNDLLAQGGTSEMDSFVGARQSGGACKRNLSGEWERSASPPEALLRRSPKASLRRGPFGQLPAVEGENYRMMCINVKSTFADNNPGFSSPEQAIQYAEHTQHQAELNIPYNSILVLISIIANHDYLIFIFENNMALRFGILGDRILASYEATGGESTLPLLGEREDCVNLRFVGSKDSFEWHPLSILEGLLKKELLDWYQLKNQYYLYFENNCIYIRTLFNVDDGTFFLFWTPSD